MSDNKVPGLWDTVRTAVYNRYGRNGLIGLLCVIGVFSVWAKWQDISRWPGVSAIVEYLLRKPVPEADPGRVSVLVAKLSRDIDDTFGNQIFEALKEFRDIQVLPLDRTLTGTSRMSEPVEIEADKTARQYLEDSGASILLWGSVLDQQRQIAKLYFTTSSAGQQNGIAENQFTQAGGSIVSLPKISEFLRCKIRRRCVPSSVPPRSAQKTKPLSHHL